MKRIVNKHGRAESAREDKATWLGDHDLSAPQTVEPSLVQDSAALLSSGRGADSACSSIIQRALARLKSIIYHAADAIKQRATRHQHRSILH